MRSLFLITIAFSIFTSCTQVTKTTPVQAPNKDTIQTSAPVVSKPKDTLVLNKTIETIALDLNNDKKADTIRLLQDTARSENNGYNTVCISITGYKSQIFKSDDSWGVTDTIFMKKKTNAIQSKWIFVYRDSTQVMLLLSGTIGGFDSGKSSVIQIKNNQAKKIFNEEWDYTTELLDIDNDGIVDIACKSHSEVYESKGVEVATYDPFYVYSLNDGHKLNMQLTQKYNEEHYVWAGLKKTNEVKVSYPHHGGKPSIINRQTTPFFPSKR